VQVDRGVRFERVGQAELKFGNSMLQLSDEMPQIGLRAPNGEWSSESRAND